MPWDYVLVGIVCFYAGMVFAAWIKLDTKEVNDEVKRAIGQTGEVAKE